MNKPTMTYTQATRFIKRGDILPLRDALNQNLDPNLSNKNGWSLLMIAAMTGDTKIGELLISKGADVNKSQRNYWTPLSLAAMKGHIPFIELLLKHGASKDIGVPIHLKYSGFTEEKIMQIYNLIGIK